MTKMIVEKYMDAVWNKKDLSVIPEVFSDDAIIHSPLGQFKTRKQMSETVEKWLTALPDIQVDLIHTLEEDGIVTSHWRSKGTHQKDINGIKANGNPVEYQGVTVYRFENGKVVEYWAYLDSWSLEQQMKSR